MRVSLYEANYSGLPILKDKGDLRFFEEVIMDGCYYQVAWLKDNRQNRCVALYGSRPLSVIEEGPAENNFMIVEGETDE